MALQQGSRGTLVKQIQSSLNALGARLSVDGIWGKKTQAAYSQYGTQLPTHIAAIVTNANTSAGSTPSGMDQARAQAQADYASTQQAREQVLSTAYAGTTQAVGSSAALRAQGENAYTRRTLDALQAREQAATAALASDVALQQEGLAVNLRNAAQQRQITAAQAQNSRLLEQAKLSAQAQVLSVKVQLLRKQIATRRAQLLG